MKPWSLLVAPAGLVLAAALVVPVRHRVRAERAPGNPVQRVALEMISSTYATMARLGG